jgi:hypothetical protein
MARNEEIDDGGGTVMVGGMDNLAPSDKEKIEDVVEVETEKPVKGRAPDEDERDEDARLAYDVSDDDDEIEERGLSRRQRRNRQRKTVVAGRDQEIAGLYQRVEALTNMIGQMGNSQIGITVQNIDTQLGAANQALTLADVEIKKAVASGDLARYEELRGLKEEAQARVYQLARHRQGIVQEVQQRRDGGQVRQQTNGQPQQQQGNNLDQRTQDFTQTFIERFDFDPNGTDERTLIIKAIDDSVAAEGYRSNTPLYWRTLEKKLANRDIYPEAGGDDADDSPPPRRASGGRPPTAGGSNNRRGTGSTFRLDPMMRDYLEGEGILDANGLSDDQKAKRSRLIKNWSEGMKKASRGEYGR